MKTLDVATGAAIADPNGVITVDFVTIVVKNWVTGAAQTFGFTDYGEDVTTNVIDGLSGATVSRNFYGDDAPITDMDPIPMQIGIDVLTTTQIILNPLHPAVQTMYRGYNCRLAAMQIHRGYLSRESMLLVAAPRIRRLGSLNGAPEEIGAAGNVSGLTLELVPAARELTRTNPATRSDETQRLRSGDRARRYTGTAYRWQYWWGQARSDT